MSVEDETKLAGRIVVGVQGFLAGITITILVLVIQIKDVFIFNGESYYEILIPGIAITSVFFIICTYGLVNIALGLKKPGTAYARYMDRLVLSGYYGIMIIIPALVLPFTLVGAVVVGAVEIILSIMLTRLYYRKDDAK